LIRNAKMPHNAEHPENTMIPPTLTPQDAREEFQAIPDNDLSTVDDAALEQALKTVNWHPQDVAQFLRSAASR
jgi:hypothetical protein